MTYLQKKKLAFMSIVNRIKGFLRTVTGTSSLTLSDCVDEESLVSLSIVGNSAQSGNPTPSAPVSVISVGDNPNLCDINSVLLTNATLSDGVITSTSTSPYVDILLPAGTYSIYIKRQSTGNIYLRNGKVTSGNLVGTMNSNFITFTYNASTDGYLRLSWFTNNSKIYEIMLVKGTYTSETMPAFIPYGVTGIPFSVNSDTALITLNRPLYKVGTFADELIIDYDNRTAKRINRTMKIDKIIDDYTYFNFTSGTVYANGTCRVIFNIKNTSDLAYGAILSDQLKGYNNTLNTSAYSISNSSTWSAIYIYLNNADIGETTPSSNFNFNSSSSQMTAFKSFIKNFTVYLPLQTEEEEDVTNQINWNSIPKTQTGTTVITATSATLPTGMEATYYSTTKGA